MRYLLLLLGTLTVSALLVAGVLCLVESPTTPPPPFTVTPTELDLTLPPGEHDLVFRITNPAKVPREIIGITEGCGTNCCFHAKVRERISVGPGETFEYHLTLSVVATGPFASGIHLYLADNGMRTVELNIRGNGVEAAHAQE